MELTVLPDSVGNLKELRHLRLEYTSIKVLPDSIGNLKELRHFKLANTDIEVLLDSIGNLKELRHFSLIDIGIEVLPDSIGNLKELTHLEFFRIPILQLPESICGLYNLQTLKLRFCPRLVKLPDKMTDLINLSHLDISRTWLEYMPVQMCKLIKLQHLSDFVVGEQQRGSGLGELGELRNLQGELSLQNLEKVVDEKEALRANLKEKKGLRKLSYHCCGDYNVSSTDGSVLQHLQPHVNVERIEIYEFRGTSLPNWVGDSSYSNLVNLLLSGCRYCTFFPPVGQLPFLETLHIFFFESVVSVGPEFYGGSCKSSIQPFQSLKFLDIFEMPRWEEWKISDDPCQSRRTEFPVLERLKLRSCGELSRVSHLFLPTLVKLELDECPKLTFPNHLSLPSLINLSLRNCQGQELLARHGASSTFLQKLYIEDC